MKKFFISGITNNSTNTCFLNSILQSLASIPSFHYFLKNYSKDEYYDKDGKNLFKTIHKIIKELTIIDTKKKPPLDVLKKSSFGGLRKFRYLIEDSEQQDAHELFVELISELDNEAKIIKKKRDEKLPVGGISKMVANSIPFGLSRIQFLASKKERELAYKDLMNIFKDNGLKLSNGNGIHLNHSILENGNGSYISNGNGLHHLTNGDSSSHYLNGKNGFSPNKPILTSIINRFKKNPFIGLWARRIKCNQCKNLGPINFSPFNNITLSIPEIFYNKRKCTIDDCLQELINPIEIEDYKCDVCNLNNKGMPKVSNIKQKTLIGRIPQSLCLHFERSVILQEETVKVPVYVEFPDEIDLSKYCLNDIANDLDFKEYKNGTSLSNKARRLFSLMAVVVHLGGNTEGGHFITYRRLPSHLLSVSEEDYNEKIDKYISSTNSVNKTDHVDPWVRISDESFALVEPSHVFAQNAYMLFYERKHNTFK